MRYRVETQTQELHKYVLDIKLENVSAKRINDWHVDVELPTLLLNKPASHVGYVRERSDQGVTLIRFTHESYMGALFPGDSQTMKISYHMNQKLFDYRSQFFEQIISARSYAESAVAVKEPHRLVVLELALEKPGMESVALEVRDEVCTNRCDEVR
jgi:hypothetical protein